MSMQALLKEKLAVLEPLVGEYEFEGWASTTIRADGARRAIRGTVSFRWFLRGAWLLGEYDGPEASAGAMFVGWDKHSEHYHQLAVTGDGASALAVGEVNDRRLVLEQQAKNVIRGMSMRYRNTFDWRDPTQLRFADERSINDGEWELVEEAFMQRASAPVRHW